MPISREVILSTLSFKGEMGRRSFGVHCLSILAAALLVIPAFMALAFFFAMLGGPFGIALSFLLYGACVSAEILCLWIFIASVCKRARHAGAAAWMGVLWVVAAPFQIGILLVLTAITIPAAWLHDIRDFSYENPAQSALMLFSLVNVLPIAALGSVPAKFFQRKTQGS